MIPVPVSIPIPIPVPVTLGHGINPVPVPVADSHHKLTKTPEFGRDRTIKSGQWTQRAWLPGGISHLNDSNYNFSKIFKI